MNARTQALVWDFVTWASVGFVIAAVPILEATMQAGPDKFDARLFGWALLGALTTGIIGAVRKLLAPQLVSVGQTAAGEQPTIVGVSLKDVKPAPPKVDTVEQQRPDAKLLDTIGAQKVDP
jgi:hypothetical protein